jgi:hypothetical protein
MPDVFISRCGSDCTVCDHATKDGCPGCLAAGGRMFWGECKLAVCCTAKGHDHCGQCAGFPCASLKEQCPDEIAVLVAWNERGYAAWRLEQRLQA